uniref:Titin n=1 Tax=Hirondellea gigas TaxID=1518452 RepID=A0A6A7G002_9CRUS
MFKFTCKPGTDNYASCDGTYELDPGKGEINDKPVYVNSEKRTFLAAMTNEKWCITGLHYFDEVFSKQGVFGGYHIGDGIEPDDSIWKNYSVSRISSSTQSSQISPNQVNIFQFTSKPESVDYAICQGTYKLDLAKGNINGCPVYVNLEKNRFLAALPNQSWCITDLNYFDEVFSKQGVFGGYHVGYGLEPDDAIWEEYTVNRMGSSAEPDKCCPKVDEASFWTKIENTTVAYKAISNSLPVRCESDFSAIRRRCIKLNCGGFAYRKAHYNQFGEEDDPPVVCFFRRTQTELRSSLKRTDKYDLYIASDDFCPDCSFKVGRDPAPACHVWWNAGKKVHAFACQVIIPKASQYTYYCACGFHCGYSGIQQHDDNKQQLLFSVWHDIDAKSKVSTPYVCDGMIAKEFGGEGMGMQAIGITDSSNTGKLSIASWTPGVPYTFAVKAFPVSEGTRFECYFHKPMCGWTQIACHIRPEASSDDRGTLSGLYSFIEDFPGNSIRRSATYSGWVQDTPGAQWRSITQVTGTSAVDDDVPNKCVKLVPDSCGGQKVEMISGGDCLPDCSLYKGCMDPPPVPEILNML